MAQAARRKAQPRAPPPARGSSARGLSAQAAGPARLVLLAVLAGALLGGCGLVVTLAAHASAAAAGRPAGPGARGALLPGAQPRRVAAEVRPDDTASAAAAGRLSGMQGSRSVQAGQRAEQAGPGLAAGAGAAAAESGLPANRAQALLPAARLEQAEVEVVSGAAGVAGAASAAEPRELPANRAQALLQPAAVRAAGAGTAGRAEVPDSHTRPVGRARAAAKRAASAQATGGSGSARRGGQRRSGAYVALCAIMKDQNADVREWVAHHAGLGVGKIYITDSGSARPLGREIADYIASGLVDYFYRRAAGSRSGARAGVLALRAGVLALPWPDRTARAPERIGERQTGAPESAGSPFTFSARAPRQCSRVGQHMAMRGEQEHAVTRDFFMPVAVVQGRMRAVRTSGGTHAGLKPLSALFPSPPQRQPGGDDRLPAAVRLRRLPGALWRPARVDGLHRRGRVPGAHGRRAVAVGAPARARARPRARSLLPNLPGRMSAMVSHCSVWQGVRPGDHGFACCISASHSICLQLVPRLDAVRAFGRC
jgi:hypothetical protein